MFIDYNYKLTDSKFNDKLLILFFHLMIIFVHII